MHSYRRLAGILLVVVPTVAFGGTSILRLLVNDPAYIDNEIRRDIWAAGHAHAGVLLVLALVMLPYAEKVDLPPVPRYLAAHGVPLAAILIPAAMFGSVLDADATEPNALINLAYVGALSLTAGTLSLGIGLLRSSSSATERDDPRVGL